MRFSLDPNFISRVITVTYVKNDPEILSVSPGQCTPHHIGYSALKVLITEGSYMEKYVATSVCLSSPFPLLVATHPPFTGLGVLNLNDMTAIGGRHDFKRARVPGMWVSEHEGRTEKQRKKHRKKEARNLNSSALWHSDKKPELGIRRSGLETQLCL